MKRLVGAVVFVCLSAAPVRAGAPSSPAAPGASVSQAAPAAAAVAPPVEAKVERPLLDVVFAIDTTGSMAGLIEGAKQKIWSLASRMASGKPTPRVRVGLVAYRDFGDAYVTQLHPLSEDLDSVYGVLKGLSAGGGGDAPEAVHVALADAVDKMPWSDAKKVAKMIFLVGDAPAHAEHLEALQAAARRAIRAGISVNTIRCGADGTAGQQFALVAKLADGQFDSIDQSGGVVATATPHDAELAKLNAALMDTALYAGGAGAVAAGRAWQAEAKAMAPAAAADRASYLRKQGTGLGVRSEGLGAVDLAGDPARAATMRDEELPAAMRSMSKEERVAFAKKQAEERRSIQARILELAKRRDEHLAKEVAANPKAFDNRVFESVKTQAAKAGVAY